MNDRDDGPDRRDSPRIERPETLEVVVPSFGKFLEQHADNISTGGMFLRSAAPPPPGTRIRFAIRLEDGYSLLNGEGEVVWRREQAEGRGRPSGMGLRFLELDKRAGLLVQQIVEEREESGGASLDAEVDPTEGSDEPAPEADEDEGRPLRQPESDAVDRPPDRVAAAGVGEDARHEEADADKESPADVTAGEGKGSTTSSEAGPPFEPTLVTAADEPVSEGAALGDVDLGEEPTELDELGRPVGYEERRTSRRWPRAVLLIVALLAAAAAVTGLVRLGALRGKDAGQSPGRPTPEEAPIAAREPKPDPEAGAQGTVVDAALSPPTMTGDGEQESVISEPTAVSEQRQPVVTPPAPSVAETMPASAVSAITWRRANDTTRIRIEPAGRLGKDRVRLVLLNDPPRALIRLFGVTEAFEPTEMTVDTPQVSTVRVWLHDELDPPQLYVVVDLVSSEARATLGHERGTIVVTVSG